jgi:tRNA(Ile2) C34 agmatinyltransferase TiaS
MSRLVSDNRSGFYLDKVEGFHGRPAIRIQQRCPIMYLDRGQDRATLVKLVQTLEDLLMEHERPLKPREIRDPPVCRQCGFRDFECTCHG